MKKILFLVCSLSLSVAAFAQSTGTPAGFIRQSVSEPSGACSQRGEALIYANALYICPQSGTATWTVSGGGSADGASTRIKAKDNSLVGNGSTDDRAALNTLVNTTMQSSGGILFFAAGTYVIGSSVSIPANVVLEFDPGAKLSISSGATVTIAGSILASSTRQIFACVGTGAVSFTRLDVVYPRWFGAVADNSTDDQAAIQKAVDSLQIGTIDFGRGRYYVGSSIAFARSLHVKGSTSSYTSGSVDFGTQIRANFSGYVFSFDYAGITPGPLIEYLYLNNSHASGGGIYMFNLSGPATVSHCLVTAYRAITQGGNAFSVTYVDVNVTGGGVGSASNGWGFYISGHSTLTGCDVTGFDNGIRVAGPGVAILGGRNEVNGTALVLGKDSSGSQISVAGFSVSGASYEANDTAIDNIGASAFTIENVSIQGSSNAPSGQSLYGLRQRFTGFGRIASLSTTGTFSKFAIDGVGYATFQDVNASTNSLGGRWNLSAPNTANFINSNYSPSSDSSTTFFNAIGATTIRSIGASDAIRGVAQGFNLRGIDVTVSSGATSIDITFPNLNAGQAAINAASAVVDGASTLAANTYYYIAALVNEIGETTVSSEKTVVVASGRRVDVTFFGVSAAQKQWKRRIYRGTASGVYDGYFDHALESSATFSDSGQAFTGTRTPKAVEGAQGTEPNANYAIAVSPAWSTAYWITNKTTSGFRINFASSPGTSSTLDWILIR